MQKRNTLVKLTWQASAKSVMDRKRTALEVKSGRPKHTKGLGDFVSRFPGTYSLIVGSAEFPIEDFLLGKVPLFQ